MFEWLIAQLNDVMRPRNEEGEVTEDIDDDDEHFVGLLDIFGFENFKFNTFEQLEGEGDRRAEVEQRPTRHAMARRGAPHGQGAECGGSGGRSIR